MSDAVQTGHPEPPTSGKVRFWLGGSLPGAFSVWAEGQIRSPWFPLRRMVPAVVVAAMSVALASFSGRSLTPLLGTASLALSVALIAVFAFRERVRRRELRRYRVRSGPTASPES